MLSRELAPSPAFAAARNAFQGLLGQIITRISYEPWSVRLLFGDAELVIEGRWSLIAPDGTVRDKDHDHRKREHFELWRVANCEVLDIQFSDDPLPWFVVSVTGQWSLKVSADEDGYEDWTLNSNGSLVVCNGTLV
jgi:hypothetical protein